MQAVMVHVLWRRVVADIDIGYDMAVVSVFS